MKNSSTNLAFVGAAGLQLFLWHRCARMSAIKDYAPPDSWHFQNVGLVAVALLLLAPILRYGQTWQRAVAACLCLFPVYFIVEAFWFCFQQL